MKGKLKFTKMFVVMIMILSLCLSNAYAVSNEDQSIYLDDNTICSGKIIPAEVSNAVFSDAIDYDSLADVQFEREISITGDYVSVNLSLWIDSSEVQLQYAGEMYKSSRYTDENPVYVGALESDSNTDFELIYFEISNGISPYNLNGDLRESASITMYLRSNEGTIYDLGSEIVSPIILEEIVNQAPSDRDINWFLNYFRGSHEEHNSPSPYSTHERTWAGDSESLNYTVAGYEHKFLAVPYVELNYADVPSYGSVGFSLSLKISESHQYRLVGETDWTIDSSNDYGRCFAIDNVELGWTAGGNTKINSIEPHLNEHNRGGSAFEFAGAVVTYTSLFAQATPLSTILSVANTILGTSTGPDSNFTNTRYGGSLTNTASYKLIFPEEFYIEESGYGLPNTVAERFELIANMITVDSTLSQMYPTYAVASFSFDFSWSDMTGQSGCKTYSEHETLEYNSNC